MWISYLFVLIILCELSTQNRILEHFEQKLNSINDRVRQTSHSKPYRGRIKRYRCIEEYVTIDEFGNVIEDSVEERKYFTTREPPTVYEAVTHLPPMKKLSEGLSYVKMTNRLHGVKSMNTGLVATSEYIMPLTTNRLRRKKKKKSKYSKSKLYKVEIKGNKNFVYSPTTLTPLSTTATPKTTNINISKEDESQNDLLIRELFLTTTTVKPTEITTASPKVTTSPSQPTASTDFEKKYVSQRERQQSPIRPQTKNAFIRPSIPQEYYDYYMRDRPNKSHRLNTPPAVANRPYMMTEIRKSSKIAKSSSDREVRVSPQYESQKVALPVLGNNIEETLPPSFHSVHSRPKLKDGLDVAEFPKPFSEPSNVPMRFPIRVEPKMKKNKDGKSALSSSHGLRSSKNKLNPLPSMPLPSSNSKKTLPAQLSALPTVSGSSVLTPEAMEKIRTENCAKIPTIASQFGISDVSGWAHNNCNLLRMFAPGATCQQIWNFIDSCKKSRFF